MQKLQVRAAITLTKTVPVSFAALSIHKGCDVVIYSMIMSRLVSTTLLDRKSCSSGGPRVRGIHTMVFSPIAGSE